MGTRHLQFWPNVPHNLTMPETSLWFNAEVSATRFPQQAVHQLLRQRRSRSRSSAARPSGSPASSRRSAACKRGDRVALYLQNTPQFVIGYYAILRADAMVVPINPMNLTKEVGHIVTDSGATVLIAAQDQLSRVEPLIGHGLSHVIVAALLRLPARRRPISTCRPGSRRRASRCRRAPGVTAVERRDGRPARRPARTSPTADDLCVMPYTSGTTGNPKGCMHRHRSVMFTDRRGAAVEPDVPGRGRARRAAVLPRHRHAEQHELADLLAARRSCSCRAGIATSPPQLIKRYR